MKEGCYVSKVRIEMVKESTKLHARNLSAPEEVVRMLGPIFERSDREQVIVISMSTKMEPVAYEVAAIGGVSSCIIDVKTLFKHAILANAEHIILAHNHPSGCSEPSKEDIYITKKVRQAGEILDITLIDSIIYGTEDNYFSFNEDKWESLL